MLYCAACAELKVLLHLVFRSHQLKAAHAEEERLVM